MKNELNVLTTGYLPLTYWKNWFRNIRWFFITLKWAWQRATKGYCLGDLQNLEAYYTYLLRDSMREYSDQHWTYPGRGKFDTSEKWAEYLENIAFLLDKSIDREFEDFQYYKNPFQEEYKKYLDNLTGCNHEQSETERELGYHYWDEEAKIFKLRKADRKKAFEMLADELDHMH